MAKAEPTIGSRRIKEDLRLPVSTVTINTLPARSPCKVPLKKNPKTKHVLKCLKIG